MSNRNIELKISLRDDLTAALKKVTAGIKSQLAGVGKGIPASTPPTTPMGSRSGGFGDILGANLLSNAISTVASGVLSAGQQLVGAIGQQFKDTADMASGQLGATSANAALLGIGFKESAKLTEDISAELAKSAVKLPGSTRDYLDAFNGVSDTLVLSQGMTAKGLTEAGKEMVELTALLGQASGAGSGTTSTVLGKMLSDTGSEALFRIDAFEKVPAFKAILEKDLAKAGKTLGDFFKMTAADKQLALVNVKRQLFSKDYIAEMNTAADAQIDTMRSQLFDPVSGVFGFLRKVKVDGQLTSVWAEVGKLISAWRGAAISILSALGMQGDPIPAIIRGVQGLSNFFKSIEAGARSLNPGEINIGDLVRKIMGGVTDALAGLVNTFKSAVDEQGGAGTLAQKAIAVISDIFRGLQESAPQLIQEVGYPLMTMFAEALIGGLIGLAQQTPGMMLSGFQAFVQIQTDAVTMLGNKLAESVSTLGNGLWSEITKFADGVKSAFSSGIDRIASALSSVWGSISGQIQSLAINAVASAIPGGQILKTIAGKYSGQNLNLMQRSSMGATSAINRVGVAFQGNLLEAINQERKMMPSGSNLVVANSSELIVPRDKVADLLKAQQQVFQINVSGNTIQELHRSLDRGIQQIRRQPKISAI